MTDGHDFTVLCVDPATDAREATIAAFRDRADVRAVGATDIAGALETVATADVDCLVAEYDLQDGTAFELFEQARADNPNLSCVLFTDRDHADIDSAAFGETVAEYLPKGGADTHDRLVDIVSNTVRNRTQVGFPLPPDEDERLAALHEYDIADLSAVESFDRLSELIASHFDVAVCFVGLVDEVQERFVACHGADWETLDREDTICTYSIVEDGVTVIENVQADPRFEYNETLKQLDIRSYAGADLTAPDGSIIGELCLIHDEPRGYTDEELTELQLFAAEVSEQLELRRRLDTEHGGTSE
ncbi:GAF domain-containing protein [Salinibaculum rarum]|uniref:GAF domain-containing protein n=1 Tax=Salinibaculum rarum TaxID=3058903 RepID=UPI00265EC61E|nr:GAF domain-containing protein [Salinibaculum sp. KK48]